MEEQRKAACAEKLKRLNEKFGCVPKPSREEPLKEKERVKDREIEKEREKATEKEKEMEQEREEKESQASEKEQEEEEEKKVEEADLKPEPELAEPQEPVTPPVIIEMLQENENGKEERGLYTFLKQLICCESTTLHIFFPK